jgi:ADP-ribosylglycohydrolase
MCIGAIAGDIIGSRFEGKVKPSRKDFLLFNKKTCFTDDTVHTLALAESILTGKSYVDRLRYYYRRYPYAGYGSGFKAWAKSTEVLEAYNSWGNGSAMRVSPIAYAFNTVEEVMEEAKKSAEVTHNHEEGIKGAQAVAVSIFMARKKATKEDIKQKIVDMGYDLTDVKEGFEISCQKTIPQAIMAFLDSTDFVDAIRRAIMFKGDSDTLACIAGSIAQPFYGSYLEAIPKEVLVGTFERLPNDLAEIAVEFTCAYIDDHFERPAEMSAQAEFYDLFRSIFS